MKERESKLRENQANMSASALSDDELELVSGGAGTGLTCTCGGKLYPLQPLTSRETKGEYQCQKCKKIFYL